MNLPKAASLGLILCLLAILVWLPYRHLSRVPAENPQHSFEKPSWLALLPVLIFVTLADILPIGAIIVTSLLRAVTNGVNAVNLTFSHYAKLFARGSTGLEALATSFWLSITTALCALVLGIAVASALQRKAGSTPPRALDLLATLPMAMPGVVVAVGLILFWNAAWNPVAIYGTPLILVVSYLTVTFPYALRYAQIGLAASAGKLDAAAIHGAGPIRRVAQITLPLAAPALAGSASVVFALSMRELVTSVMLQPPGVHVISTYIMNQFLQGDIGDGMAMAVVGLFASAILLGVAQWTLAKQETEYADKEVK